MWNYLHDVLWMSVCDIQLKIRWIFFFGFLFNRNWSNMFIKLYPIKCNVAIGWRHRTVLYDHLRRLENIANRCCDDLVGQWPTDTSWQCHPNNKLFADWNHCNVNTRCKSKFRLNLHVWMWNEVQSTGQQSTSRHRQQCSGLLQDVHHLVLDNSFKRIYYFSTESKLILSFRRFSL